MLSSPDSLKTFLSVAPATTVNNAVLDQCVQAADRAVKTYCKRDLESASYTWYLTGNNTPRLILPQRPVPSVTSIWLDLGGYYGDGTNAFASTTVLTAGSDYVLVRDGAAGESVSGVVRRLSDAGAWYPSDGGRRGTLSGLGRREAWWPDVPGCIKVAATAGYAAGGVPLDLQLAINELAAYLFRTRKFGGAQVQQEGLGDYHYALGLLANPAAPPEIGTVRQLLSRYKEQSL